MTALWKLLVRKGFAIMMSGFVLAVIALIVFMKYRTGGEIQTIASTVAIIGLTIYVFGRILVIINKRTKQPSVLAEDEENK